MRFARKWWRWYFWPYDHGFQGWHLVTVPNDSSHLCNWSQPEPPQKTSVTVTQGGKKQYMRSVHTRGYLTRSWFELFLTLQIAGKRWTHSDEHVSNGLKTTTHYPFVCFRLFFAVYHGKSALKHHLGHILDYFQPPWASWFYRSQKVKTNLSSFFMFGKNLKAERDFLLNNLTWFIRENPRFFTYLFVDFLDVCNKRREEIFCWYGWWKTSR